MQMKRHSGMRVNKHVEWEDDDDKCCFYCDDVEAHDHVGVKNRGGEDEEDGS